MLPGVSKLTNVLVGVESPRSLSTLARSRRWRTFARRFLRISEMRVIDLGGTPASWLHAPVRPLEVMTVNLSRRANVVPDGGAGWIRSVSADACELPAAVRAEHFDLVFSNSVLEHVGGHARRAAFAETVHALAEHHWVQTPYRYFPIEPHFLFPGFQLLPVRAQAEVAVRWPIGNYAAVKTVGEALKRALAIELLSVAEMSHYFPESSIEHERIAGVTKSLIAIR
jgi:hypothetical protein